MGGNHGGRGLNDSGTGNTNATYGPTTEAVMSRRVKVIMSIQVVMALLMLTVLIARSVAATT